MFIRCLDEAAGAGMTGGISGGDSSNAPAPGAGGSASQTSSTEPSRSPGAPAQQPAAVVSPGASPRRSRVGDRIRALGTQGGPSANPSPPPADIHTPSGGATQQPAQGAPSADQVGAHNDNGQQTDGTPDTPTGQPTPQQAGELISLLRDAYGLDVSGKYKSDSEAIAGLVNAARLVGVRDADAEYGRYVRQYEPQIRAFMQQQQRGGVPQPGQPGVPNGQSPAPTQTEPERDPVWDPPVKFNPRWRSMIEPIVDAEGNPTGRMRFAEGTPPQDIEAYHKWAEWKESFDSEWQSNPRASIERLVEKKAEEIAQRRVQQTLQEHQHQNSAAEIIQQNSSWIFHTDQGGQVVRDQFTGQPIPTPRGKAYMQYVQVFGNLTADPRVVHQLADQMSAGQVALTMLQQMQGGQVPQTPIPNQQVPVATGPVPGQIPSIPSPPALPPGGMHQPARTQGARPTDNNTGNPHRRPARISQRIIQAAKANGLM